MLKLINVLMAQDIYRVLVLKDAEETVIVIALDSMGEAVVVMALFWREFRKHQLMLGVNEVNVEALLMVIFISGLVKVVTAVKRH